MNTQQGHTVYSTRNYIQYPVINHNGKGKISLLLKNKQANNLKGIFPHKDLPVPFYKIQTPKRQNTEFD